MLKFVTAACLAALSVVAAPAHAATTVVDVTTNRSLTISSFDPVGQTFTADGNQLSSFGFQLVSLNPTAANTAITLTLYDGAGFGGAVLATRSILPTNLPLQNRAPGWLDFDLTGTALTPGNTYTAALTTSGTRFALNYGPPINIYTGVAQGGDAYTGGNLVATNLGSNRVCATGICDSNFRFTTLNNSAVPEPATWAMMLGGFGAMGLTLRRRRGLRTLAA